MSIIGDLILKVARGDGAIVAPRFVVSFGYAMLGFQSVSGISINTPKESINEGGRDTVISVRTQASDSYKLTFTRGYVMRDPINIFSNLLDFCWKKRCNGMIIILDIAKNVKAIYGFQSEGVVEWSLSDLNAMRSEQLIETFTITHSGLVEIPIPNFLNAI